jgi:OmpA-OmpF porin, OOP family
MTKNQSRLILAFVFTFGAPVAYSDGWYFGLGLGTSSYDLPGELNDLKGLINSVNDIPGVTASFDIEDSDTAVKLFSGFNINSNFAVEFGYVDLGEISADFSLTDDGSFTGEPGSLVFSGADSVSGFSAGLVGRLPLSGSVSVSARVGAYFWELDSKFAFEDTIEGSFSGSESDDGQDIYYGLGLDIGWFGLFYEVYDIDGEDVDFLGVSASFGLN